jgi:prephenate dehydratase
VPASCSRSGIQDYEGNTTRFLVIGKKPFSDAPADKTSIVFTLPNEAGALFKALSTFALRGIDLTKLESRPMPSRKWEYLFYMDVKASATDPACARALAHLGEMAPMLRVLGSYASCRPVPVGPRA